MGQLSYEFYSNLILILSTVNYNLWSSKIKERRSSKTDIEEANLRREFKVRFWYGESGLDWNKKK